MVGVICQAELWNATPGVVLEAHAGTTSEFQGERAEKSGETREHSGLERALIEEVTRDPVKTVEISREKWDASTDDDRLEDGLASKDADGRCLHVGVSQWLWPHEWIG
jgi:hypothetical protein